MRLNDSELSRRYLPTYGNPFGNGWHLQESTLFKVNDGEDLMKQDWVTLSNDDLSLMPLINADVEMLHSDSGNDENCRYELGAVYVLRGGEIEGVELGNNIFFRLYGIIDKYKDVDLNCLIMKEVCLNDNGTFEDGVSYQKRRKFSMPPSMCKEIGIKYQIGLELWSQTTDFVKVNEKTHIDKMMSELDYKDLSTYPTSDIDNTIRKIILELHNFAMYGGDKLITPSGRMVDTRNLLASMTISFRENIPTDNGCAGWKRGETVPFKVVVRPSKDKVTTICDEKHNLYVEIDVTKDSLNVQTPDNRIGISPSAFNGKDIDDVICVKWLETYVDERAIRNRERINAVMKKMERYFNPI